MGTINLQITLEDHLLQGKSSKEQEQVIKEALAIRGYINDELSMGEVAEILGMNYLDAHDWMNRQRVPTMRRLPPSLEKVSRKNRKSLGKELGI